MIKRIPSALLYYLVILPISVLPFFILYRISDGLFVIFYYLLGYRKKVIVGNIERSFPDMSASDRQIIARAFYRHFCDLIVESLKVFTISEKQVKERMKFENPEVMDQFFDKGQSVILAGGHFNNWELFAVGIDAAIKHRSIAIYKPLNNPFFDEKMRSTRGKFGLELISTREVKEVFEKNKNELTATIFGTDQSPGKVNKAYWTKFLNQDTAVMFGTEKFARDYNFPVVYGCIHKVSRGHYTVLFKEICREPSALKFGEITEMHTRLLEEDILKKPEFWLWSHRRWKHKRPASI